MGTFPSALLLDSDANEPNNVQRLMIGNILWLSSSCVYYVIEKFNYMYIEGRELEKTMVSKQLELNSDNWCMHYQVQCTQ